MNKVEQTRAADAALPVSKLRELFFFTPSTGVVVWRSRGGPVNNLHLALQPAGGLNGGGYIQTYVDGRPFKNHRLAWALHHGEWPDGNLDHIDRDKTNNRINNLRIATPAENGRNTGPSKNSASGIKGVHWCSLKGKWRAQIMVDRKNFSIGSFDTREDAAMARAWADLITLHYPLPASITKAAAEEMVRHIPQIVGLAPWAGEE